MFKLTREVRFALECGHETGARNGHAGVPPATRVAPWGALRVTLAGELNPASQYLLNIKDIDTAVRNRAVALLVRAQAGSVELLPGLLAGELRDAWPPALVSSLDYALSPFLTVGCVISELPMIRLSQKFEFSASHRLHNDALSDEENRRLFGKCNNPHGHGHNYELQVTLRGEPASAGGALRSGEFERIVDQHVIQPFDHKHLNLEVPEFASLNPTVENIAVSIYRRLRPRFTGPLTLYSVTVWETPRTWCEYSE